MWAAKKCHVVGSSFEMIYSDLPVCRGPDPSTPLPLPTHSAKIDGLDGKIRHWACLLSTNFSSRVLFFCEDYFFFLLVNLAGGRTMGDWSNGCVFFVSKMIFVFLLELRHELIMRKMRWRLMVDENFWSAAILRWLFVIQVQNFIVWRRRSFQPTYFWKHLYSTFWIVSTNSN